MIKYMGNFKEFSKNNVPSVIIDTAESFRKDLMDKEFLKAMEGKLDYISVYNEKIPIDIFARRNITIEGKQMPEEDFDIAMRCTQILSRSCGLSQLQEMEFTEAIMDVFEEKAGETITIRDVYDMLRKNGGKVTATRIDSIVCADVFKNNGTCFNWKNIFNQGKCLIFSLSGYKDERVKRMIAESILQDLWSYALECGNEKNPFAVVCDEIGNTPPQKDSALSNMLHLGRKFGVMCVWNT